MPIILFGSRRRLSEIFSRPSYASNKLISSMILGMDRPDQIKQNLDYLHFNIPNDLWSDLFKEKLIDERCPLL